MTDKEKHELQGPVHHVVTRWETASGEVITQEQTFDPEGRITSVGQNNLGATGQSAERHVDFQYDISGNRQSSNIRVVRQKDGGRIEKQGISGADGWSMDGLHGFGFGTRGASIAETYFDAHGAAVKTIFRDGKGNEFSRITYTCDSSGNILEAVQHAGGGLWWSQRLSEWVEKVPAADAAVVRGLVDPGVEQVRIVFRYDHRGHISEVTTYFFGQLADHTVNTYNEFGDINTSATDNQPHVRFEYDHDERGNWTRKVAHYSSASGEPLGSDESLRTITYYD